MKERFSIVFEASLKLSFEGTCLKGSFSIVSEVYLKFSFGGGRLFFHHEITVLIIKMV